MKNSLALELQGRVVVEALGNHIRGNLMHQNIGEDQFQWPEKREVYKKAVSMLHQMAVQPEQKQYRVYSHDDGWEAEQNNPFKGFAGAALGISHVVNLESSGICKMYVLLYQRRLKSNGYAMQNSKKTGEFHKIRKLKVTYQIKALGMLVHENTLNFRESGNFQKNSGKTRKIFGYQVPT